jgi:hypothetical protein
MIARTILFLVMLGGLALAEAGDAAWLRGLGIAVMLLGGVPFVIWWLIDFVQVWILKRRSYWD